MKSDIDYVMDICDSEGVSYEERRLLINEYVEAHK